MILTWLTSAFVNKKKTQNMETYVNASFFLVVKMRCKYVNIDVRKTSD